MEEAGLSEVVEVGAATDGATAAAEGSVGASFSY